jgi:hypothetical protein
LRLARWNAQSPRQAKAWDVWQRVVGTDGRQCFRAEGRCGSEQTIRNTRRAGQVAQKQQRVRTSVTHIHTHDGTPSIMGQNRKYRQIFRTIIAHSTRADPSRTITGPVQTRFANSTLTASSCVHGNIRHAVKPRVCCRRIIGLLKRPLSLAATEHGRERLRCQCGYEQEYY